MQTVKLSFPRPFLFYRQLILARIPVCIIHTCVEEAEDAAEAGVVGLNVVGVELEDEVRRRRVEASLSERRQRVVAAQLVVPPVLLVHFRSVKVEEQTHEVRAPAHADRHRRHAPPVHHHHIRIQEDLAVASIARDDPSTVPGDDPFPRARMHRDRNAR